MGWFVSDIFFHIISSLTYERNNIQVKNKNITIIRNLKKYLFFFYYHTSYNYFINLYF